MKSLKAKPLSTNNGIEHVLPLDTRAWHPFCYVVYSMQEWGTASMR